MRHRRWTLPALLMVVAGCAHLAAEVALDELAAFSRRIDEAIDSGLRDRGLTAPAPASEEIFVRRLYLDAIGRIPTVAEQDAYFADPSADRRGRLIERLLSSEGHVSNEFTFWADLLRVQTRSMGGAGEPYIDWLKDAIRSNKPYDRMATELVTAEGSVNQRGNGATGFWLRDRGMPLDHFAAATQVFLATRMGCAQCHNHPFDTWTRAHFMQMAGFTANVTMGADPAVSKVLKEFKGERNDPDVRQVLQDLGLNANNAVTDRNKATLTVPKDYQYKDLKPGTPLPACTVMGITVTVPKGGHPRQVYAAWLTAPDNPRFTRAIANRLWKRAMGVGVFEPVDDLRDDTVIAHPTLMQALESTMQALRFNLRAFQAVVFSTRAYQRQSSTGPAKPGDPWQVAAPTMRRLSAEQIWDSLLTLVIPDPDARSAGKAAAAIYTRHEDLLAMTQEELVDYVREQVDIRKRRKELQDRIAELRKTKGMEAVKDPEFKQAQSMLNEVNTMGQGMMVIKKTRRGQVPVPSGTDNDPKSPWKGFPRSLVRASELPSPAPLGHLLRDFGQSDRMAIDNSSSQPVTTQCLNLMNGIVDNEVLNQRSALMKSLAAKPTPAERIALVFRSVLSRAPSERELAIIKPETRTTPAALGDAVWSVLNTGEFLFQR